MPTQLPLDIPQHHRALDDIPCQRHPIYAPIHVRQSTFLNGTTSHVHRWFRLTPSFGPDLVEHMIDRLAVGRNDVILDPFAGAGTTLIQAKMAGRNALGFEVNPFLHFVNQACLDWNPRSEQLRAELVRLKRDCYISESIAIEDLSDHGISIPPIHNPTRWWRPDILVSLLFLRRGIASTNDPATRRLLTLAFAAALVPDLTNVTLGRLQLHFIDRTSDEIDVWAAFSKQVLAIAEDLDFIAKHRAPHGEAKCFHHNALNPLQPAPNRKVAAVITSPPYPNRYSYVWNTRPHMYMLGFMKSRSAASELDKQTIGGTWGTATSELARGAIKPRNAAVHITVGATAEAIREKDNLMANYVVHYFNRLCAQVERMEDICTSDFRVAYVVGNSRIKGVYVETDVLFGEMLEHMGLGYRVLDIHRFRRRHSGTALYESIVYASK